MSDDWTVTAGDSFTLVFSNVELDGETIDLTGWTLFVTGKEHRNDSDDDAVFSVKVSDHIDVSSGKTAATLLPNVTRAIYDTGWHGVYWDAQWVSPDGSVVKTTHRGKIKAKQDVTVRAS